MGRALLLFVLLAGCTSDPCEGTSGACISLLIESAELVDLDGLRVTIRSPARYAGVHETEVRLRAFPVTTALVLPALSTVEDVDFEVEALRSGLAIGSAEGDAPGLHPGERRRMTLRMSSLGEGADLSTGDLGTKDLADADAASGRPISTARLVSFSARLFCGTGDDIAIGGFHLDGSSSKGVIARGLGPSLGSGSLANPLIELYDSGGMLETSNDDWQSDPEASAVQNAGLAPTSTLEAALHRTLPVGFHSVSVRGAAGETGTTALELHEADVTAPTAVFGNLSVRGQSRAGGSAMAATFVIGGTGPLRVALRALGPSISSVSGTIADPMLLLSRSDGTFLAQNNDWQSTQAAELVSAQLQPGDPREAAIIVSLMPGAYSVVLLGNPMGSPPDSTGLALLELYSLGVQ